ncbi:ceramide glucosyltransferase [Cladophialophora yegresii CBS 114405]|uniref:Ceramide glucosyltransferase n=1 Tax=Cladophialophora yegresii CBS 114405 TaxID=1182544 RepID=W9WRL8_9EURO|nr:ceramide glucosyltransferase [Cladophialophora yegresii CBS 114405]EXJ60989.1 ceramide glucosyltransferase [Cladophialophora yegresii CBS 114405]
MFTDIVAAVCIAWYIFIACVCGIGYVCLFLYYRQAPQQAAVLSFKSQTDIPNVTVIRPCKGLEPYLYECLASTFYQDYPRDKIAVHFCVSSRSDPAHDTLRAVVRDHPGHNARIFVEEEDDGLANGDKEESQYRKLLGPNPKIRNMSKAYRESGKNHLIWIIDCNVWVGRGVCARMVDRLCGFTRDGQASASATPYKLVHHLPISVDVDTYSVINGRVDRQLTAPSSYDTGTTSAATGASSRSTPPAADTLAQYGGGRLEEIFLSSSHAKMYVAINTVAVAPCIIGKSTMFRRAHLDYLTSQAALEHALKEAGPNPLEARTGIDFFSHNICEDHLIGDLLWKSRLPATPDLPGNMRNHGLVFGDLAIQPISSMSVTNYISRRVRWLRVRKFTVPVATLVEPGTESFLCSAMGSYGLTTSGTTRHWAGTSWTAFWTWWVLSILCWMAVDWTVFLLLHSGRTVEVGGGGDENVPAFARPLATGSKARRKFTTWMIAWLGREALALPVWSWAIWGGTTVAWRDGKYWVGLDMRVHETKDRQRDMSRTNGHAVGVQRLMTGKERIQ